MATGQLSGVIRHLRRAALVADGGGMTDGQLLECFISRRDEAAFEALVRRHGPMVLGVCRRVLCNIHDAEDAFQATFLVLVRKATAIGQRELLGNWLYGAAYRAALEAKAARRRVRERQVIAMPESEAIAEAEDRLDLRPILDQELSRLPDKYRVPVVLCDLEGRTRRDVARQLGIPVGTLSGRLTTARRLLAKRLARQGFALASGTLTAALSAGLASACLRAPLVVSTVKAATAVAAGEAAASGVISAKVAALTEGVLKTMFLTKLKFVTAVLLIAGMLGGGWFASLAFWETPVEAKAADANRGAAPAPAPKAEKQPKEVLEKAAAATDDVRNDAQKAFALMKIATAQAKAGDQATARKTFQQAVRAAEAIQHEDPYRKGATLMFITKAQAEASQPDAALETASTIVSEGVNCKEWALAAIAAAQGKAKNVKGALETVARIPESGKPLALMKVAASLAEAGDPKQALKLAEEIQDDYYRVEALTKIAKEQLRAGDRDGAKKVIDSAWKIADEMEDSNPNVNTSRKTWAQTQVALAQIALGEENSGLKRADDFKGSHRRDKILADVAIRRAKAGKVKEASRAVEEIQDGVQKGAVLRAVAAAHARAGDFKTSRKSTDAIELVGEKVEALLDVAAVRLSTGGVDAAVELYREAIQALKTLDTLWYDQGPMCATPSLVHKIASAWAEAGDAKGALAWADKQESAFVRAVAFAGIAEGIGKRQDQAKRPAGKK